jgi:hypothetical protein
VGGEGLGGDKVLAVGPDDPGPVDVVPLGEGLVDGDAEGKGERVVGEVGGVFAGDEEFGTREVGGGGGVSDEGFGLGVGEAAAFGDAGRVLEEPEPRRRLCERTTNPPPNTVLRLRRETRFS